MGWNSWYSDGGVLNETHLMATADGLVSSGLAEVRAAFAVSGLPRVRLPVLPPHLGPAPKPPRSAPPLAPQKGFLYFNLDDGFIAPRNTSNPGEPGDHDAAAAHRYPTLDLTADRYHTTTAAASPFGEDGGSAADLRLPPTGGRLLNGSLCVDRTSRAL